MQQGNAPLKFQEVIRLTSFGIDTKCFKFGVTNFESDKYISIKDIVLKKKKNDIFFNC